MTRETKAGLVVSCSFLCLVGAVVFNKMREQPTDGTKSQDASAAIPVPEEPSPILSGNPARSLGNAARAGAGANEQQKPADGALLPVDYRERGNSNPILPRHPSAKEPAANGASPTVKTADEPPGPASTTTPADSVPLINSVQAAESKPEINSPPAANDPPVAHAPGSPPSAPEGNAAAVPAHRNQAAAPDPRLPGRAKTATTAAVMPTAGDSPRTPLKGLEASESAGPDAKPAMPLPVPAGNAPAVDPPERPATSKPAENETPLSRTAPPPDLSGAEVSKPADKGLPTPSVAKDRATLESSPKPEVRAPAGNQVDSPKPAFQLPAAPPSAAPAVPTGTPPATWPDKVAAEGTKADIPSSVDSRPAAANDPKLAASGADHQAPGPVDGPPRSAAATAPSTPTTASPYASQSSDFPARTNPSSTLSPSSGLAGSSDELRTRQGSNGGLPPMNSPSQDRNQASLGETRPLQSSIPPTASDTGMDKGIPPESPGAASGKWNRLIPTPAPQGSSSERPLSTRPLPPLGAPASIMSPPVPAPAPFGPRQTASSGAPQVESYDESTYTCKANDTFRQISQAYYHTDQYERALLLFNRSHPLATNAVRQDPPMLQPGQSVYIPPARILEKYYGAPALDSAPAAPVPQPSARPITRLDANGSALPANTPLVAAGPPVKIPSPEKLPLYRVREGGEMMREVAGRTLGSGDRWIDILRLNPRFDPKDVIKGSSVLRLPRDAHVDPQDLP